MVVRHGPLAAAGCSEPASPFSAPAAAAAENEGAFPECKPEGDLGGMPIKREPEGAVPAESGSLPAPDSHDADSSPRLLLEEPGTSSASAFVGEDGALPLMLLSPAVRDRGSHGTGSGHLVVTPSGDEGEGCLRCALFCSGSHAKRERMGEQWSRWFFLGPRVQLLSLEGQRGWTAERFDSDGALWVRSPRWFRSSMWGLAAVAELCAPGGRLVRMELHIGRHPAQSASRYLGKRAGRVVKVPFVWWDPHPGFAYPRPPEQTVRGPAHAAARETMCEAL